MPWLILIEWYQDCLGDGEEWSNKGKFKHTHLEWKVRVKKWGRFVVIRQHKNKLLIGIHFSHPSASFPRLLLDDSAHFYTQNVTHELGSGSSETIREAVDMSIVISSLCREPTKKHKGFFLPSSFLLLWVLNHILPISSSSLSVPSLL